MTLSGLDLQAVCPDHTCKMFWKNFKLIHLYKDMSSSICLYDYVNDSVWLGLARWLPWSYPDILLRLQVYLHTVQVCTSTYSASTKAQKHTQCKQCTTCSTHLYPHCPDHTLSGRHLHKQSFRAAFHWCTAFQGCSELSFSLDSHSALLFTALSLAFHWGWSGAMSLSWSCSCTLAAPRSQWAGPGQCTKPNFIV